MYDNDRRQGIGTPVFFFSVGEMSCSAESDPDPAETLCDTDKVLPDASGVRVRCSCRHSEKDTAIPVVLIVLVYS